MASYELWVNGEKQDEIWINGEEYVEAWTSVNGTPTLVWKKADGTWDGWVYKDGEICNISVTDGLEELGNHLEYFNISYNTDNTLYIQGIKPPIGTGASLKIQTKNEVDISQFSTINVEVSMDITDLGSTVWHHFEVYALLGTKTSIIDRYVTFGLYDYSEHPEGSSDGVYHTEPFSVARQTYSFNLPEDLEQCAVGIQFNLANECVGTVSINRIWLS